jgi:cell division protein ZipA
MRLPAHATGFRSVTGDLPTMDNLRLILLIAGLLLVGVIWIIELRGERRARRARTILGRAPDRDRPVQAPAPDEAAAEPGAPLLPPIRPVFQPAAPERPAAVPEFIAIHVEAGPRSSFGVNALFAAAEASGLLFGPPGVFQMPGPGGSAPLFTVANMVNPGTFERDDSGASIRGLTLIMTLPSESDAGIVFDLMVRTAEALAATLGGAVHGPDRRPLGDTGIEALRRKARGGEA